MLLTGSPSLCSCKIQHLVDVRITQLPNDDELLVAIDQGGWVTQPASLLPNDSSDSAQPRLTRTDLGLLQTLKREIWFSVLLQTIDDPMQVLELSR
ncbi:hypothetical protein VTJ04DRAFT_7389 [Mycothermus thermophilus]|uniref:uncharacterized protein n=1 Tax=Humicola insolens TaxID=85995 RepID=UPI0037434FDA